MNITIIHGGRKTGSTYAAVGILKEELLKLGDIEFTEFILPMDMPHFCNGCFTCFFSGEDKCPHARDVQPIVMSLRSADGIILSSPVFVCDASGAMKAFFDHLAYMWMPHRPMDEMFKKAAVVLTTTAGAGAVTANRTMKKNLRYWGVKRIYGYGTAVAASSWEDVKADKKEKIHKSLKELAPKFFKAARDGKELRPRLFTRFMFIMIKKMQHGYPEGHRDREYWKSKGWLDGKRPF